MKIKFCSDFNLILKLYILTIIVRSAFEEEDGKYYPKIFLDDYLHEL